MNEYQTFLKSIMRNQTLAILLKVTSPAIQAVFTQTAEETKAQLFQLVDKTEENMHGTLPKCTRIRLLSF